MSSGGYKLYGRANAGSLAVQIVFEEIGAPYELLWVGTTPAELEAFGRINPAAKVPALVLPDGTPVVESAAIVIHLTDAHPTAALAPACSMRTALCSTSLQPRGPAAPSWVRSRAP